MELMAKKIQFISFKVCPQILHKILYWWYSFIYYHHLEMYICIVLVYAETEESLHFASIQTINTD